MPVKKDESGRRYVQAEVEVIGTPEEVWKAIATGPGISSWFVPTEVEATEDGTASKVISHFAPDSSMDSVSTVGVDAAPSIRRGESWRTTERSERCHGMDGRGSIGWYVRRARGPQLVRQQRRVGQPVRGVRVRLARVLPDSSRVSRFVPGPTLLAVPGDGLHARVHGQGVGDPDAPAGPTRPRRGPTSDITGRRAASLRRSRMRRGSGASRAARPLGHACTWYRSFLRHVDGRKHLCPSPLVSVW
jgi:hypothetical protein